MDILGALSQLNRAVRQPFREAKIIGQYRRDESFISKLVPADKKAGSLLVIRLDDIGDYILFRNALATLKTSGKYAGSHITLCGNKAWKPLFDRYDSHTVDDTIWIDKTQWGEDTYRSQCYTDMASRGFETVFCTSFTRNFTADDLLAMAAFPEKSYAWALSYSGLPKLYYDIRKNSVTDEVYTDMPFRAEYLRNMEFMEQLTGTTFRHPGPVFDNLASVRKNAIVLFPGASKGSKRWPAEKFAELADSLLSYYPGKNIIIAGAEADAPQAADILEHSRFPESITDMTGKTNLEGLLLTIAGACLLVTNDTVALHMAIAVKTPVVCIANGTYHWRYTDYSWLSNVKATTVLPPHVNSRMEEASGAYYKTGYQSSEIKLVETSAVLQAAMALLPRTQTV